jgi:ABC-type Fe3+/spermidine/putrescine transport system ATPase subunit
MSDRIAVMNEGRIEQLDAPDVLYGRPRTRFVADFLGVKNILEATVTSVEEGLAMLRTRGGLTLLADAADGGYQAGGAVTIGVRSERMTLDGPGPAAGQTDAAVNRLAGALDDELYLGDRTDWRVAFGAETLTVAEGAAEVRDRRRGEPVTVTFPASAVLRLEIA